jgi:hypothetical protein
MKKILISVSYILHPIFIPIFACLFYFFVNENYVSYSKYEVYLILLQVVILTFMIPISFYYLLKSLGKIDSIMVSELSQRKLPLFFQAVLLFVLINKGATEDRIPELYYYFLAGLISTILAILFLFTKIKASLHMLGIGSLLVFVIGISIRTQTNFLISIGILTFLTGIVASSRLEMKAHDFKELSLGLLIGIIPQIVLWYFWL